VPPKGGPLNRGAPCHGIIGILVNPALLLLETSGGATGLTTPLQHRRFSRLQPPDSAAVRPWNHDDWQMIPIYILAISIAPLTDCTTVSLGVLSYTANYGTLMWMEEIAVAVGRVAAV